MTLKGFLAVPLLGAALAACSVTVTPTAPSISNVNTQATYCATTPGMNTNIDIKFDLGGVGVDHVSKLDIFFADAGASTITDEANTPHDTIPTSVTNVGGASRFVTSYTLTPNDLSSGSRVSPSAIIITPNNKRIFLRAWNGTVNSGFVAANNSIAPSTDPATCDPGPDTVQ